MSKGLKKKSHWTSRVHEIVLGRSAEGRLGFELRGGAENGQFPYLGDVRPGQVAYEGGSRLVPEELLLEVNETPVAGLTLRDVLAVIKHCKDPLRLKCVKQGTRGRRGDKLRLLTCKWVPAYLAWRVKGSWMSCWAHRFLACHWLLKLPLPC
uniref:PDZ domain-containing protein n=1 Tax=Crocodylus porosus TaxID=8502 RepID=A0A7M4FAV8_CROPO